MAARVPWTAKADADHWFSWSEYSGDRRSPDGCICDATSGPRLGRRAQSENRIPLGCGSNNKILKSSLPIVAAGADVIVTSGQEPAKAAAQVTNSIPIVMAASANILASGLVKSLAQPGGNVTGLTFSTVDTVGKRFELLKEAVPGLSRVAVLFNPDANPEEVAAASKVAPPLGIVLDVFEFRTTSDLERIATHSERSKFGALFVVSDPLVFTNSHCDQWFCH